MVFWIISIDFLGNYPKSGILGIFLKYIYILIKSYFFYEKINSFQS